MPTVERDWRGGEGLGREDLVGEMGNWLVGNHISRTVCAELAWAKRPVEF